MLRATSLAVAVFALAACSSSGSGGPSGRSGHASTQPAGTARTAQSVSAAGTDFCSEERSLALSARRVSTSLSSLGPDQLRRAVEADLAIQAAAVRTAPAPIRRDVELDSRAPQYRVLANAGYDMKKVTPTDLAVTPTQRNALADVRSYVLGHCGFDVTKLATSGA